MEIQKICQKFVKDLTGFVEDLFETRKKEYMENTLKVPFWSQKKSFFFVSFFKHKVLVFARKKKEKRRNRRERREK